MRNSKAKQIRAAVKLFADNLPEVTTYVDQKHKAKSVKTYEVDHAGNRKVMIITPITRKLGDCERKLYQEMKKVSI